uniref:(northern house mosquito) hypothetical protein n=1 Tax=Culex pipiens TaxID=7175 RepID=A0A8D7ZU86_CULPI
MPQGHAESARRKPGPRWRHHDGPGLGGSSQAGTGGTSAIGPVSGKALHQDVQVSQTTGEGQLYCLAGRIDLRRDGPGADQVDCPRGVQQEPAAARLYQLR